MNINIPKGQRVRIRKYDSKKIMRSPITGRRNISSQDKAIEGLNDANFILMEPLVFNINSNFTDLIKTEQPSDLQYIVGEGLKAIGANTVAGIVTGVTEYSGFQRWSGTDPISTELSVGLISQGDAKKDVIEPMLHLINLTIPKVDNTKFIEKARVLRLPGPSIMKVINDAFNSNIGSDSTYTSSDTELTICVGNLIFDHVIITGVTPTIMPDTDENGYPLSVFLKIAFKGTRIPNDDMLKDIFAGWYER